MENFLSALKDLAKYTIISKVSMGDKTLDSMISAVLLSMSVACFTVSFWKEAWMKVKRLYYKRCGKKGGVLTEKNYEMYRALVSSRKDLKTIFWDRKEEFSNRLLSWVSETLPWVREREQSPTKFNMKEMKQVYRQHEDNSPIKIFTSFLSEQENYIIPVYISKNNRVVSLKYHSGDTCIAYEAEVDFKEFVNVIKSFKTKDDLNLEVDLATRKIKYQSRDIESVIHTDRSFDNLVTKHKPLILHALEDLKKSLNSVSQFGGFGSYNLGIMLHGLPGTGKTSIIKAVCNYLQRDAYIVDMRKIKTTKDFVDIFCGIDTIVKKVYIFEEIDCVKGILSRKIETNEAENEVKQKSDKDTLKQEYIELLKLSSQEKLEKDGKSKFAEDIEALKKKIEDAENQLTLDTMLTVLDGIDEMRGRVIIATTNYIERIDSALLREGRFDLKIKLEQYDENETRELLTKMFKSISSEAELNSLNTTKLRQGEFTPVQIINLAHKYRTLSKVLECVKEP